MLNFVLHRCCHQSLFFMKCFVPSKVVLNIRAVSTDMTKKCLVSQAHYPSCWGFIKIIIVFTTHSVLRKLQFHTRGCLIEVVPSMLWVPHWGCKSDLVRLFIVHWGCITHSCYLNENCSPHHSSSVLAVLTAFLKSSIEWCLLSKKVVYYWVAYLPYNSDTIYNEWDARITARGV